MRQIQRFASEIANTQVFCPQEQRYIGITKPVDGLHRIAHEEQRSTVASLPTGREQFKEPDLRAGRVLKLIHENVLDPSIQREQKIRRLFCATESTVGR